MKTNLRPLNAAALAAIVSLIGGMSSSATAADLQFDTKSCDVDEVGLINAAVQEALNLLISNRQGEPGIEQRAQQLAARFFGVVANPQTDADRSWNTVYILSFSNYEAFVNESFTAPEQSIWPVQGRRITFRCDGTSMRDVADLDRPSTIVLNPLFTGRLPGGGTGQQLPLIEQSSNATLAGTILHEMVHAYTGGVDICQADQCNASNQAEINAAAHNPVVFSTPTNYEIFYQLSYPIAPEL